MCFLPGLAAVNDLGHDNVRIGMDQYCLNSPTLDSLTVKDDAQEKPQI